jgi:hypothetical protein
LSGVDQPWATSESRIMPQPVIVTIEHHSSPAAIKERLNQGLAQIHEQIAPYVGMIEEHWDDDRMTFRTTAMGQAVHGHIDVDDRLVRVEVWLPGILGIIAGAIATRIQRDGERLLNPPS